MLVINHIMYIASYKIHVRFWNLLPRHTRQFNSINIVENSRRAFRSRVKLFPVLASHVINHPRVRATGEPCRSTFSTPVTRNKGPAPVIRVKRGDLRSIVRSLDSIQSATPVIRPRSIHDGRLSHGERDGSSSCDAVRVPSPIDTLAPA